MWKSEMNTGRNEKGSWSESLDNRVEEKLWISLTNQWMNVCYWPHHQGVLYMKSHGRKPLGNLVPWCHQVLGHGQKIRNKKVECWLHFLPAKEHHLIVVCTVGAQQIFVGCWLFTGFRYLRVSVGHGFINCLHWCSKANKMSNKIQ